MNIASKKPASIEDFLQHKALEPVSAETLRELDAISCLNVATFSEADVRQGVIDPIVKALGYRRGTAYSMDLERALTVVGEPIFPDYRMWLWERDFWIIEAKKPGASKPKKPRGRKRKDGISKIPTSAFGDASILQAIQYAAHPDINAALMVICDGVDLELYDRESTLEKPVLHLKIADIEKHFDKLRAYLSPLHAWFFEKRRTVRALDRVLDKEFNLGRLEELQNLINRRFDLGRSKVLENAREKIRSGQIKEEDILERIKSSDIETLCNVYFFQQLSLPQTNAMLDAMVAHCRIDSFRVLHLLFPDEPRDADHIFWAHTLAFLVRLEKIHREVNWLPAWLQAGQGPKALLRPAITYLLELCLTHFRKDEARKTILLAASALRRLFKAWQTVNHDGLKHAELRHAFARYFAPELSQAQLKASPAGQSLAHLDDLVARSLIDFLRRHSPSRGSFNLQSAKIELRSMWNGEIRLVGSVENYPSLLSERAVGEIYPTEWTDVTYDSLGHTTLCLLDKVPDWKEYALLRLRPAIETIAQSGSWQAREWLGYARNQNLGSWPINFVAERFFFGDEGIARALYSAYSGKSLKSENEPS